MEDSILIPTQESYSIYLEIILPVLTIYVGIFVTLSNHYVLRPKI